MLPCTTLILPLYDISSGWKPVMVVCSASALCEKLVASGDAADSAGLALALAITVCVVPAVVC